MQAAPPSPHSLTTVPIWIRIQSPRQAQSLGQRSHEWNHKHPSIWHCHQILPPGSITTNQAWRGHCSPYLEGKLPVLLGELADFSVHLGFFSLQVLALLEGLVQAPHQAVGKEVVKEGMRAGSWQGYQQGLVLLDIAEETKGSKGSPCLAATLPSSQL